MRVSHPGECPHLCGGTTPPIPCASFQELPKQFYQPSGGDALAQPLQEVVMTDIVKADFNVSDRKDLLMTMEGNTFRA